MPRFFAGIDGEERHRRVGHHPRPAPKRENPERWDCDHCNHIWRILTPEQVRQKFAHLRNPPLPDNVTDMRKRTAEQHGRER